MTELTLEKILEYRRKKKAVYGVKTTIPFFGREIVPPGGTFIMVSEIIPLRFELNKITADFAAGVARSLEIYVFVSNDNRLEMTGFNPLSINSPTPFLVGDNKVVTAHLGDEEFKENRYIKIAGINRGRHPYSIDVGVTIKTFPNL